ncbi:hypothetical protein PRIPAC_86793, partial [Pristionchus pacificus]|uniref:Uncharacterized protein n=1 Tax=Pristionchus pacificus TaxID=54126 RepID=A0A2A6CC25_PRIPA
SFMTCVAPANDHTYFAKLLVVLVEDFDGGVNNFIGGKGWRDVYGGSTEGREGGRSMEGKWSRRMRGKQVRRADGRRGEKGRIRNRLIRDG